MKNFLSHLFSASIGAMLVVIILIILDIYSTFLPVYIPNIFFKERINVYVDVESVVSEAVDKSAKNVVSVSNYSVSALQGTGSGVIYDIRDDKAYIVTNNHVVENAFKIEIETVNGYKATATLVGTDNKTDLAVLTIPKGNIDHKIEFSDSNALKVGEYVIAIGNPLGLSGSATLGIISSKERLVTVDTNGDNRDDSYASVIQTDAAINPGNSGGALINLNGNLVGINSMKIADTNIEGIGFSIPSKIVERVIADLETYGEVIRPFLGIYYISVDELSLTERIKLGLTDVNNGIYVDNVEENSSASKQGIQKGDIILAVNDYNIDNLLDFAYQLYLYEVGDTINLTIIRDRKAMELVITLESNLL
ncbi:MAG: trypsin [Haloplasmataceae bacterium]|jgi:serine protease Do|nr:trypsin [Haloplasmataceae bacterium]